MVLNGITGSIGLLPTLAALKAGSTLALANKESLIVGGALVKAGRGARARSCRWTASTAPSPSACAAASAEEVRRLVVTASGGPFRGRSRADLEQVTVTEALAHPNFAMGPVITTNSATLVNKGLEVIEAHLLFDIPFERIDVVVHPQQMVHSMVEFHDGSTIAQASPPSMLIPIALGLGWPDRRAGRGPGVRLDHRLDVGVLPPRRRGVPRRWPSRGAWGRRAATYPAVFNAANEECVEAFLGGTIPFLAIVDTVARVVQEWADGGQPGNDSRELSVESVLQAEAWARARARTVLGLAGAVGRETGKP